MPEPPPRPAGAADPDDDGSTSPWSETDWSEADWSEDGSAGRQPISPDEADPAALAYWDGEADAYQAEHGEFLAGGDGTAAPDRTGSGFVWGPEGVAEQDLALLGPGPDLLGRIVVEVGCGGAQCSRWLAARGVCALGVDISVAQLRHARRGVPVPVVAATATALPLADGCADAAFAAYGAVQFVADLPALMAEVARVLRPGGRWVFSVTHPIRWAFPDSPGPEGLTASGSYFDRTPYVERDGSGRAVYAEFHRTVGDYVRAVRAAGLEVMDLVEPEWPDTTTTTWGGWSPLRGRVLPGTLIVVCRAPVPAPGSAPVRRRGTSAGPRTG